MPSFEFNEKTRTYFKDARPVEPDTLRSWVSEVMQGARSEMEAVTKQFVDGEINRAAWTIEMRGLISQSHGAVAMLAQGGRNAMDEKAWGRVGNKIKTEVSYLRGFEREIANGRAGSNAEVLARAQLYANGLWAGYQNAVLEREKGAGVARVLRVLGEPQTGHCSDCPDLAGEYSIDEVPEIGASECGSACNCEIISVDEVVA